MRYLKLLFIWQMILLVVGCGGGAGGVAKKESPVDDAEVTTVTLTVDLADTLALSQKTTPIAISKVSPSDVVAMEVEVRRSDDSSLIVRKNFVQLGDTTWEVELQDIPVDVPLDIVVIGEDVNSQEVYKGETTFTFTDEPSEVLVVLRPSEPLPQTPLTIVVSVPSSEVELGSTSIVSITLTGEPSEQISYEISVSGQADTTGAVGIDADNNQAVVLYSFFAQTAGENTINIAATTSAFSAEYVLNINVIAAEDRHVIRPVFAPVLDSIAIEYGDAVLNATATLEDTSGISFLWQLENVMVTDPTPSPNIDESENSSQSVTIRDFSSDAVFDLVLILSNEEELSSTYRYSFGEGEDINVDQLPRGELFSPGTNSILENYVNFIGEVSDDDGIVRVLFEFVETNQIFTVCDDETDSGCEGTTVNFNVDVLPSLYGYDPGSDVSVNLVTESNLSPISILDQVQFAWDSTTFVRTLNDTGSVFNFRDDVSGAEDCILDEGVSSISDCRNGRDALSGEGLLVKQGSGYAGFDFQRLDSDGSDYNGNGNFDEEPWACVKDNLTGLVWLATDYSSGEVDERKNQANTESYCGQITWRESAIQDQVSIRRSRYNSKRGSVDLAYFDEDYFDGIVSDPLSPDGFINHTPDDRFTNNGDGTVTDNQTGLVWALCSYGKTGNACQDGTLWFGTSQQEAMQLAYDFELAGYTDWRVPNIKELLSIVDYYPENPNLYINLNVFFSTNNTKPYMSSTYDDSREPLSPWLIHFRNGIIYHLDHSCGPSCPEDFRMRLVRGGEVY